MLYRLKFLGSEFYGAKIAFFLIYCTFIIKKSHYCAMQTFACGRTYIKC